MLCLISVTIMQLEQPSVTSTAQAQITDGSVVEGSEKQKK